jgi:DNA-binding response OmpR family regulator
VGSRPATIIVLEESAAALELMQHALSDTSDFVLLTHDPAEVLELAERIRIDLVIGSAAILGRDPAWLERLQTLQSELRILYLSHRLVNTHATLRTPFALHELTTAVEQALGRGSQEE